MAEDSVVWRLPPELSTFLAWMQRIEAMKASLPSAVLVNFSSPLKRRQIYRLM